MVEDFQLIASPSTLDHRLSESLPLAKERDAHCKTELCDKVLNLSGSCEPFDLGSPVFIPDPWFLLRKEVIQPQVPLRLPCYDFIPITIHTFGTF
jgi:hypothetical protein